MRFLYVKNVGENLSLKPTAKIRKEIISALLRKPNPDVQDLYLDAWSRLFRLFDSESRLADNILPSNVMAYVRYTSAWIGPDSYVFFTDESWRWTMQIRQRVQESSICYMHAPVVLQSYLISWNFRDADQSRACEMLDIKRYIKENFSPRELLDHIVDD